MQASWCTGHEPAVTEVRKHLPVRVQATGPHTAGPVLQATRPAAPQRAAVTRRSSEAASEGVVDHNLANEALLHKKPLGGRQVPQREGFGKHRLQLAALDKPCQLTELAGRGKHAAQQGQVLEVEGGPVHPHPRVGDGARAGVRAACAQHVQQRHDAAARHVVQHNVRGRRAGGLQGALQLVLQVGCAAVRHDEARGGRQVGQVRFHRMQRSLLLLTGQRHHAGTLPQAQLHECHAHAPACPRHDHTAARPHIGAPHHVQRRHVGRCKRRELRVSQARPLGVGHREHIALGNDAVLGEPAVPLAAHVPAVGDPVHLALRTHVLWGCFVAGALTRAILGRPLKAERHHRRVNKHAGANLQARAALASHFFHHANNISTLDSRETEGLPAASLI
mmetsp:Transcript_53333/g.133895  ORF Transcript_53333/g.133895 Transcript_53333/m.133895 type:complete len:392 (+) Transcript_53333:86-1261(+)